MVAQMDVMLLAGRLHGADAFIRPCVHVVRASIGVDIDVVDAVGSSPGKSVLKLVGSGIVTYPIFEIHIPLP